MATPQTSPRRLNRTLKHLRTLATRTTAEAFSYDPETSAPPEDVRYMTLDEAKALDCNMCGQCCGSADADPTGLDLRRYTFGAIEPGQWARLNGGAPLIIPLTRTGRPRAWRPSDGKAATAPAFQCAALSHVDDGTTRCALWQARRPPPCDAFPVGPKHYPADLRRGIYLLLNTTYLRHCTWTDVLVCPDDSVILDWRNLDGTLRRRLSPDRWQYVYRVFAEAYRDTFQINGMRPVRHWRALRKAEAAWR
ncbi:MAG: hypothetical protein EXR68_07865 [Dehalococcoidia bacterium]|nr:hypothetical protein [Dehalococcoidia bacterium]